VSLGLSVATNLLAATSQRRYAINAQPYRARNLLLPAQQQIPHRHERRFGMTKCNIAQTDPLALPAVGNELPEKNSAESRS